MSNETTGAPPRRTGLIGAMTDAERASVLAFIAGTAPGTFDDAVGAFTTRDGRPLAAELAERIRDAR